MVEGHGGAVVISYRGENAAQPRSDVGVKRGKYVYVNKEEANQRERLVTRQKEGQ